MLATIGDLLSGAVSRSGRGLRWRRQLAIPASTALLGGAGFVFACLGLHLFLAQRTGPILAAALMSAIFLLLTALVLLVGRWRARRGTPTTEAPRRPDAGALGERIGEALRDGSLSHGDIVLMSLVAGLLLGASPALRDRLGRLVRGDPD